MKFYRLLAHVCVCEAPRSSPLPRPTRRFDMDDNDDVPLAERMKRRGLNAPAKRNPKRAKMTIGTTRKSKRRASSQCIHPVKYVNWMDDDFVRNGGRSEKHVTTWTHFVESIGDHNLKRLPIIMQEKNDCSICAAVTAYEVQSRSTFPKSVSSLGAFQKTKEEGAHLFDQIGRVWGNAATDRRPYPLTKHKTRLRLDELVEHVRKGVVYLGLEELGYPWANRAVKDEYGNKERFIAPRYDPYNNPWEHTRRSGADGHACCVIGMFYCEERWNDCVPRGHPRRRPEDVIGNVFCVKDTTLPCGWSRKHLPWSKFIAGFTRPREEFAYSLLPFDLFTTTKRDGGSHRRMINDAYFVPMSERFWDRSPR